MSVRILVNKISRECAPHLQELEMFGRLMCMNFNPKVGETGEDV